MINSLVIKNIFSFFKHSFSKLISFWFLLVVVVVTISSNLFFYYDFGNKINLAARSFGANLRVYGKNDDLITIADHKKIAAKIPADKLFASSYFLYNVCNFSGESRALVTVDGVNLMKLNPLWKLSGSFLSNHVVLGARVAQKNNVKVGDLIRLGFGDLLFELPVSGVLATETEFDDYILTVPSPQFIFTEKYQASYSLFSINSRNKLNAIISDLQASTPDFVFREILQVTKSEDGFVGEVISLFKVVVAVISVLTLLVLCINMTLMILARRKEFALRKSLGASNIDLFKQMVSEVTLLIIFAFFVGVILGYLLTYLLSCSVFNVGIAFSVAVLPLSFILTFIACLIAITAPLYFICKIDPAVTLKEVD